MDQEALAATLDRHATTDPTEARHAAEISAFVRSRPRPFDRAHLDGHLTASAVIIDPAGEQVLLGYHRKLGRWLQLGGHGEPADQSPEEVALREAHEESSLEGLALHPSAPRPLDVDIHPIPARGDVPAHQHLDLRYLVVAPAACDPSRNDEEHHEVRWFRWDELDQLDLDASLQRALAKVRDFLRRP